ncbi:uncharacterized protein LOC134199900 [Bombyx mori]|uniref:uncharacterized protein LOC134199900 n=1 Tax=Bombyx mori TaxID=7091 RepID=UPI002ED1CD91
MHRDLGKIVATSNGKEVMRLQMNKPCDHLFIRPILKTKLNATSQCVILKGQYTFKLDYEDLFESYYAGSFVYGNWTFKATVYGNHCNFGPFTLKLEKAIECKGPKRKNCTDVLIKIDNPIIEYNILVKEDVSPSKGKITAIANNTEMFIIHSQSPCTNLFIKYFYHKYLNMTNSCIVKKGRYVFELNINEVFASFYKGVHVFGVWTFKALFYNENCNFDCSLMTMNFLPKRKT